MHYYNLIWRGVAPPPGATGRELRIVRGNMGEQIEDGVADDPAFLPTAPAPLPLPLADPPAGNAIAIGRGDGDDVPVPPAQPEPLHRGLEMPNVTPQLGALVLVASGVPSFLEGSRLREDNFSDAQTYSRCVMSCTHHERCAMKNGSGWKQVCHSGPREPLAFLADWHLQGPLHATAFHAKASTLTEIKRLDCCQSSTKCLVNV